MESMDWYVDDPDGEWDDRMAQVRDLTVVVVGLSQDEPPPLPSVRGSQHHGLKPETCGCMQMSVVMWDAVVGSSLDSTNGSATTVPAV